MYIHFGTLGTLIIHKISKIIDGYLNKSMFLGAKALLQIVSVSMSVSPSKFGTFNIQLLLLSGTYVMEIK